MESHRSIFAHVIPAEGVDFPSCEKVVKMIVKDLDTLGYQRVVFRSDNEPSILSLLRTVKLAWTGHVVQERSAEGDPQSNGAAESSVNVVKGHARPIKLAVESASSVEVPADHDLLTWLVPYAATNCRLGPLDSRFEEGRYLGPMDGSNTVLIGTASGVVKDRTIKRLPPCERWTGSLLDEALGSELTPNALEDAGGRVGIRALVLQPHEAVPLPPLVPEFRQV